MSPSSLARYLRCPKSFYYNKILGISDVEESDEEEMDARTFGNIFHKAAELLYRPHEGHTLPKTFFDGLLNEEGHVTLSRLVDEAIRKELFKMKDDSRKMPKLGGLQVINREMVLKFLRNLVSYDASMAPITILGLEKQIIRNVMPDVKIIGFIDRIDKVVIDGKEYVRIIDYKTGSQRLKPLKTVDDIFDNTQAHSQGGYYLQTMLYARIVRNQHPDTPVAPALLFIQHAAADDYNPILKLGSDYINDVATPDGDQFVRGLQTTVNDIFDPSQPFTPTPVADRCQNCPYHHLCT